jgi:hypothetical protein
MHEVLVFLPSTLTEKERKRKQHVVLATWETGIRGLLEPDGQVREIPSFKKRREGSKEGGRERRKEKAKDLNSRPCKEDYRYPIST